MSESDRPRLRRVAARRTAQGELERTRLFDPLGLDGADAGLVLSADDWALARELDGATPLEALATRFGRPIADVLALVRVLSEKLLLDDDASRAAIAAQLAEFRARPTRAAVGAGAEYEADAIDLRIRIAGLIADDWDMPPPAEAWGAWTPACDFRAAAPLYSRTYAALRHFGPTFARALVLAPAGGPLEPLLVPLDRVFETPLGASTFDERAFAALAIDPGASLLAHRRALALERQVLFLRLLFPKLPLLAVLLGDAARVDDKVEDAVRALRRVTDLPGRTLVIAAADLAERGETSGSSTLARAADPLRRDRGTGILVTSASASRARELDSECIDRATRIEPQAFWSAMASEPDDGRRAQALAPYLLLRLVEGRRSELDGTPVRGSLLGYLQIPRPRGGIGAASVLFH